MLQKSTYSRNCRFKISTYSLNNSKKNAIYSQNCFSKTSTYSLNNSDKNTHLLIFVGNLRRIGRI